MSAGVSAEEALRLGERMYMNGLLPSGKPMTAVVQGDIELDGTMSTCANCHRHSGLGSLEGGVLTPPTNGVKLYAPLLGMQDMPGSVMKRSMFNNPRPAYNDESLAAAIRDGIGPTGKKLSDTMPRYLLDEDAMKIMISYLKSLTSKYSPGVSDDEIRFATILADNVTPGDRDALLLPLQTYFREEWNARLSVYGSQWQTRWLGAGKVPGEKTYRSATLDVWELKGPPSTWQKQLEEYYRKRPVFAVLGGMAQGDWAPIHNFCEHNKIPCILPITDLPTVSAANWHTLYFSKGYYQEGEAAAKYLSRIVDLPPGKQVVQVFRNSGEGHALSRGFADTWKDIGTAPLTDRTLSATEITGADFWKSLAAEYPNSVILVWLNPADLAGIESLAASMNKPSTFFFSATLLNGKLSSVPDIIRDLTFITYPTRLPDDGEYTKNIVTSWMKIKKIPVTNLAISSKMYILTRMLSFTLLDMGRDFYRDFFLDLLDDSVDQINGSLVYPALSFGPGQRYASKGCYIVTIPKGDSPQPLKLSDWVIY